MHFRKWIPVQDVLEQAARQAEVLCERRRREVRVVRLPGLHDLSLGRPLNFAKILKFAALSYRSVAALSIFSPFGYFPECISTRVARKDTNFHQDSAKLCAKMHGAMQTRANLVKRLFLM